jgi:hypothetical protein
MKNWLAGVMLFSAVCVFGCTRADRPEGQSSETHFLALCSDNACGPGLRCVCGVCSAACEVGDDAMCGAFAEDATCGETADGCSTRATCDVTCENDADCEALGPMHACSAGRCRAEATTAPAPPASDETSGPRGSDVLEQPPCPSNACMQHGVCYPLGSWTEDGCCNCEVAGFSCIDPDSCTGKPPNIAARCKVDRDCGRGLTCRMDFLGGRGLCTRSCNNGCPTLTTCADAVPGYNGGAVSDVCMRPCETNADCPFGTTCAAPSDGPRYCY